MRIAPSQAHPHNTPASSGAPSAPGVHDTLRANLGLSAPAPKTASTATSEVTSFHPLESRLARWQDQQESMKMELLRRQFGIAEPVKRGMELAIVRAGEWRPSVLGLGSAGSASLHADILSGRDTEISWDDVFTGEEMRDRPDFHVEMERKFGMNW